jgi:membrane protease YdiL (CAAX protease family)
MENNTTAKQTGSILFIIIGYIIIYGVLELSAKFLGDLIKPENALIVMACVLTCAVLVEIFLFKNKFSSLVKLLGLNKPSTSSIIAALVITGILFSCYPLITYLTGYTFVVPADWAWLAVGVFALHGVAEEVLYRAFLFRRLRERFSFWKAGWIAVLFFAVAHIPIIISQGLLVGGMAVILSIASSFPLSWLYEKGNDTIWAPAIVHAAIDTVIPILAAAGMNESTQIAVSLWMVVSIIVPYSAFLLLKKAK